MYRPTGHAPRARTGRRLLVVVLAGAALAAVALLWWAGTSGGPGGAGSAAPGERQDPAAEAGYLAPAVAAADPVASAVAWLQATRSVSYADGSPSGWVDSGPARRDRPSGRGLRAAARRQRGSRLAGLRRRGMRERRDRRLRRHPAGGPAHRQRGERAGRGSAHHHLPTRRRRPADRRRIWRRRSPCSAPRAACGSSTASSTERAPPGSFGIVEPRRRRARVGAGMPGRSSSGLSAAEPPRPRRRG